MMRSSPEGMAAEEWRKLVLEPDVGIQYDDAAVLAEETVW